MLRRPSLLWTSWLSSRLSSWPSRSSWLSSWSSVHKWTSTLSLWIKSKYERTTKWVQRTAKWINRTATNWIKSCCGLITNTKSTSLTRITSLTSKNGIISSTSSTHELRSITFKHGRIITIKYVKSMIRF